jgi:HSP20 family protein
MIAVNRVHQLFQALQQSAFTPLHSGFPVASHPATRLWGNDNGLILELDLPGRSVEQFEVTAERNLLSIDVNSGDSAPSGTRLRQERTEVKHLEFQLPFEITAEKADLSYVQGVLRIALQKPDQELPQKLVVKQG